MITAKTTNAKDAILSQSSTVPVPPVAKSGRILIAAVAMGAVAAAAAGHGAHPKQIGEDQAPQAQKKTLISMGVGGAPSIALAAQEVEQARVKYVAPVQGAVTAEFGPGHNGVDIANAQHAPIFAAADGVIVEAGHSKWVRQRLADGTVLVYGHMQDFSVKVGQKVQAGQQIAQMGTRHMHFEVWAPDTKKIDPQAWLLARGVKV